jgi:23S rRNA (guanosine2251-2'-O)-methyltransferase
MPYVAGRNAVLEAIQAARRVRRVLVDAAARSSDADIRRVVDAAEAAGIPVERIQRTRLDAIALRHQGVVAEVEAFAYTPFHLLEDRVKMAGGDALVLVLDSLQDPQNFGTLLRTALAARVTGVIIPERRAVGVTPAVTRASAGAVEHLAVSQVPNLTRALESLKRLGLWVVGLDAHNGTQYDEADLGGPLALVVGSEGSGLGRLVRESCDFLVHLPMTGPTESLNAAVAGSIVLYHVFRAHTRSARG